MSRTAPAAETRQRAPQKRAAETRDQILGAATELFSTRGYDGVSLRTIETGAGVKRGLVAYHFGTKEELWRAAVDALFRDLSDQMLAVRETVKDQPVETRLRINLTAFVRYSAMNPELNRIMAQEARAESWRSEHLVENYVRPLVALINQVAGRTFDVHSHYILIGAATFVFNVEFECMRLFGEDPRGEDFITTHANRVADLLLGEGGALQL